jgi:hypothetical protein
MEEETKKMKKRKVENVREREDAGAPAAPDVVSHLEVGDVERKAEGGGGGETGRVGDAKVEEVLHPLGQRRHLLLLLLLVVGLLERHLVAQGHDHPPDLGELCTIYKRKRNYI